MAVVLPVVSDMYNIKNYLKEIGVSKQDLAKDIRLSRPTLDLYISMYERGDEIPRERYQIIFDNLFKETLTREEFLKMLNQMMELLERDEKLGTEKLEARGADAISRIKNRMLQDMSKDGWDPPVYMFIEMLIANYRKNNALKKLGEYFAFMYTGDASEVPNDEQKAYFTKFYALFEDLNKEYLEYCNSDYEAMLIKRKAIFEERKAKREEKQKEIKRLVTEVYKDLEKASLEVSDDEIFKAILAKLKE